MTGLGQPEGAVQSPTRLFYGKLANGIRSVVTGTRFEIECATEMGCFAVDREISSLEELHTTCPVLRALSLLTQEHPNLVHCL